MRFLRDKVSDISPNKKGKISNNSKGKETTPLPEAKKRATKSNKGETMGAIPLLTPREGTSATLLKNPSVVEKLLEGVIPLVDKE